MEHRFAADCLGLLGSDRRGNEIAAVGLEYSAVPNGAKLRSVWDCFPSSIPISDCGEDTSS